MSSAQPVNGDDDDDDDDNDSTDSGSRIVTALLQQCDRYDNDNCAPWPSWWPPHPQLEYEQLFEPIDVVESAVGAIRGTIMSVTSYELLRRVLTKPTEHSVDKKKSVFFISCR